MFLCSFNFLCFFIVVFLLLKRPHKTLINDAFLFGVFHFLFQSVTFSTFRSLHYAETEESDSKTGGLMCFMFYGRF